MSVKVDEDGSIRTEPKQSITTNIELPLPHKSSIFDGAMSFGKPSLREDLIHLLQTSTRTPIIVELENSLKGVSPKPYCISPLYMTEGNETVDDTIGFKFHVTLAGLAYTENVLIFPFGDSKKQIRSSIVEVTTTSGETIDKVTGSVGSIDDVYFISVPAPKSIPVVYEGNFM